MTNLTKTMMDGLREMAKASDRYPGSPAVLASPNDNTGRALEKRGLIKLHSCQNWNRYTITDAGRKALDLPATWDDDA